LAKHGICGATSLTVQVYFALKSLIENLLSRSLLLLYSSDARNVVDANILKSSYYETCSSEIPELPGHNGEEIEASHGGSFRDAVL